MACNGLSCQMFCGSSAADHFGKLPASGKELLGRRHSCGRLGSVQLPKKWQVLQKIKHKLTNDLWKPPIFCVNNDLTHGHRDFYQPISAVRCLQAAVQPDANDRQLAQFLGRQQWNRNPGWVIARAYLPGLFGDLWHLSMTHELEIPSASLPLGGGYGCRQYIKLPQLSRCRSFSSVEMSGVHNARWWTDAIKLQHW